MLTSLNKETSKFMFTPEEWANFFFRGECVSFVHGFAGCLAPTKLGIRWQTEKGFIAIRDSAQADWMTKNADVFTLGVKGSTHCVYWINVNKLKE